MKTVPIDQIKHLPEYLTLIQARRRVSWLLSAVIITVYFALILVIAFAPDSLGESLTGGVTSIGIVLGLAVILLCFAITGFYVYYANHVLQPLAKAVIDKVEQVS